MEVRDLAILRILQETRNITHAADRLYMAQSAVSKRVKAIERELGVVLLLRSRHGVRFTPAGEAVLRYEKAAGSQLEQLHQDAARLGVERGDLIRLSTSAGSLTVAANPTRRALEGTVYLYHGYREADANSIVPPGHNDPYSGFPGYRSVRCRVEKEAQGQ